jgi:hypothetical protein
MDNILEYIRENREKATLLGYFVLILILAWPIAQMLGESWEATKSQDGLAGAIVLFMRFGVFDSILDSSHQTVTASVFGLYLGLLTLMTIDPKKRWQAFLLWLGTIVGLIALQSIGLVLPQLDVAEQAPALLGGLVVGILLGGGRQLLEILEKGHNVEFRRASQILFLLLAAFVVISLLELHIEYPGVEVPHDNPTNIQTVDNEMGINGDGFLLNVVVSGIFIVTVRRFVKYDADKAFFILGPRASGKSLFLIGTYLEALKRARSESGSTPLEPSQDLMSMLEALDRQESEWIVEATGRGELKYLSFQYVHGSVFPTNIRVSAMDYAGEYLMRLPDAITGAIDPDDMDNTLRRLAGGVENADTLILTIDIDRFESNEPLDIQEYFTILQASKDKDVLLVATKADVIADQFKEERGLDAHLYYEEFTQFVNMRLRQSENIDALVTETAGSEIHPVYYQTKVNQNGDRVPMRDETGSVMTVGFDQLLDKMGRL